MVDLAPDPALVYDLDEVAGLPPEALTALLGGKAANLSVMAGQLGLPVPPAFTLTTAACRAFLADGRWPAGLEDQLPDHVRRLEARVGRRFGDPAAPLLVSVRSGGPVSMPGMLDTVLNLGLTDGTARGLAQAAGDPAFADDCRRRLQAMYREIVGSDTVPEDPWEQLRTAIEAVFRSWTSERAVAYRRHEGIADDLGTAATVQAMVFGNLGPDSGTGVLFTRNPSTGEPAAYGDILVNAQGEDVVAGTHRTRPIADLDRWLPDVARELQRHARTLEHHFADLCDIEFTIERGRLWLLQARVGKRSPEAALRLAVDMAEDPEFPLTRAEAVARVMPLLADPPGIATLDGGPPPMSRGLGASPGVATGEIATSPEGVIAAAEAGRPAILVRSETSPDDVHGMERAVGVLTSTGGFVSHAAVVARGWGIPAVVGAAGVHVDGDEVVIEAQRFRAGDVLTIDGTTGRVFVGVVEHRRAPAPEVETLRGWARELGLDVAAARRPGADPAGARGVADLPAPRAAGDAATAGRGSQVTPDALVRSLGIRGTSTLEALAAALGAPADELEAVLRTLVVDGLAEDASGGVRLTIEGKGRCRELIAADAERLGADRAAAALDAFGAFDQDVKDLVTAWQVRDLDGAQAINDHADAAYDANVLDRLRELHGRAGPWLSDLAQQCPTLAAYRRRLDRALDAALAGDARQVASPRVDSYHGVWFELHEELIRLAGRRRAAEVAAGRA